MAVNGANTLDSAGTPAYLRKGIFLPYGDPKVAGKALPVDTRVLTPTGWRRIGDLVIGDLVVDPDGGSAVVEGVFDQGVRDVFRVTMSDGGSVLADGEHLWFGQSAVGEEWRTLSTREIGEQGLPALRQWHLPVCAPVSFRPCTPVLDPYALGGQAFEVVPDCVYDASLGDRLAFLQGVLDAHGEVVAGRVLYTAASKVAFHGIREIARSLGGVVYAEPFQADSWQMGIRMPVCPFRLEQKRVTWQARPMRRTVETITPAGQAECRCISVASKRNLFVTEDWIVTHNTTMLLRAFPRALVLGRRDAIAPVAFGGCGFQLADWQIIETVTNLTELVNFLSAQLKTKEWQAALKGYGITALIVDDFSQMAMKSVIQWTAQATEGNKHYPYKMLDRTLDEVSIQLADLGLLCGLSAHKMDPRYDLNEKSRTYGKLVSVGAPEVPSSKQVQAVPGWTTLVAPVRTSTTSLDPWWPKVLSVDATTELWISGDRNSVCWEETPANLREILRAAPTPYDLPRLPGYEWQDETADRVADALDGGESVLETITRIFEHYATYALAGTPGERHVQWAVQDGIARHTIRARRKLGVLAGLRPAASAAAPPPTPAKA